MNQSIALGRAGAKVYHAGAIGADGKILKEVLKNNGVDVTHIDILENTATGHAMIQVIPAGQNSIILFGGANQEIGKDQIDKVLTEFDQGDILVLQNEISENSYIMMKAHEKGMKIYLNPSPCDEKIKKMPLEYVDCFLLNEVEAAQICGEKEGTAEKLSELYPKAEWVLTLGERGVVYRKGVCQIEQKACSVKAVDTTAAGDTFTGFYIGCRCKGAGVEESLRVATMAAGIAVTRKGAQDSIPFMSEVLEKMKEKEA